MHINHLELLAAYMALQAFKDTCNATHVLLMMDNTTAVAYIKNMGGKKPNLNELTQEIWNWCIKRNTWLSATHIPGKLNIVADYKSRHFNDRTEWSLHQSIFDRLVYIFGKLDIDLFATRLNAKCEKFVSWHKEPYAFYVDAFSCSWQDANNYLFPPFSLIGRCLQKLRLEEAEGVIVLPLWSTQPWFTTLLGLLVQVPVLLPKKDDLLTLTHNNQKHPLRKKLQMIAAKVSGKPSRNKEFLQKQPKSSYTLGKQEHISNMQLTSEDGTYFVFNERLIYCDQMFH
jgi:hypothetical protein